MRSKVRCRMGFSYCVRRKSCFIHLQDGTGSAFTAAVPGRSRTDDLSGRSRNIADGAESMCYSHWKLIPGNVEYSKLCHLLEKETLSFARKGVYVIIILRVVPPKLTTTREGHSMVASSICLGIFMNIVTTASRHYQYCLCQLLFPA